MAREFKISKTKIFNSKNRVFKCLFSPFFIVRIIEMLMKFQLNEHCLIEYHLFRRPKFERISEWPYGQKPKKKGITFLEISNKLKIKQILKFQKFFNSKFQLFNTNFKRTQINFLKLRGLFESERLIQSKVK